MLGRWDSVPVVAVAGGDPVTAVAETYRAFARREARGPSAAYESLAESVADDAAVVGFIASLPPDKRPPPLVFPAAPYLLAPPPRPGPPPAPAPRSPAGPTPASPAPPTPAPRP